MNQQQREQLSALIDDELGQRVKPAVSALINNREALGKWSRYHLIGNTMRRHLFGDVIDITERIRYDVTPLAMAKVHRQGRLFDFLRPLALASVALTVVSAVFFGIHLNTQDVQNGVVKLPMQVEIQPDAVAHLSRYLISHNEYRSRMGVRVVSPHMRMVAGDIMSPR